MSVEKEPVKRIYVERHVYFEVRPESGWVMLKYKGKTVKKRRLKEVYKSAIFNAFEEDLKQIAGEAAAPPISEKRVRGLERRAEEISRKIDKILKRIEELGV